MLPPIGVAFWYGDGAWMAFVIALIITLVTGLLCWFACRHSKNELKAKDGFFIVVLFWSVLSLFGALPLMIAQHPHLTFTNAVFESVSGLTTTGATVLTGIDKLPHAILFYRQQLQFLGGMGIVVLAVAVLPMLGIGGMQLYRAENTSLAKESKLTPRVAQTAKLLWYLYVGLVVLCALAYWAAGMSLFDAICQSFSTVATGGFSTHDASMAYFNSTTINMIGCVFMLLGGTNFSLHYYALQKMNVSFYLKDIEFKTMIIVFAIVIAAVVMMFFLDHSFPNILSDLEEATFNTISIGTTTGLTVSSWQKWPYVAPILMLFLAIIGASAASTSGGMKMVRMILLVKQGSREIKRLIHPQGVIPIKLGSVIVDNNLLQAVSGFVAVLGILYVITIISLMACGLDFQSAFGNSVCALGNLGITVGANASGFGSLNVVGKWIMVVGMLAGRLEVFSLLVLFSPSFWRR